MKNQLIVSFAAIVLATASGCAKGNQPGSTLEASSASPATEVHVVSAVTAVSATPATPAGSGPAIKVYKDANCGCCKEWVTHLEQNGFKVESVDMPDLSAVKQKYGVKSELESCHTGVVNGYTVEGHVPADLIKKMLAEKPAILGLAVPGMVTGSPGMEGATKEKYDVLTFDRAGRTTVYAKR